MYTNTPVNGKLGSDRRAMNRISNISTYFPNGYIHATSLLYAFMFIPGI